MTGLCVDNTEGRVQTLLYIQTTATSGNIVRGHVDLAERVNKSFWKDNINRQAIIGKKKFWLHPIFSFFYHKLSSSDQV